MQIDAVGPRLWCKVRLFGRASPTLRPFEYVQIKALKNSSTCSFHLRFRMHGWAPECCVTRSEMSASARTRCDTKDSDAWSKLNQPPLTHPPRKRRAQWEAAVRTHKTELRREEVQRTAPRRLSWESFISASVTTTGSLWKSCPRSFICWGGKLKIVHQRSFNRRERERERERKNSTMWHANSPAERLDGVSIQEVVVPGDGRDVDGKLGIWAETVQLAAGACTLLVR